MNLTDILLYAHSGVRWLVVAVALLALLVNLYALARRSSAKDQDGLVRDTMRLWTVSLDIQWLLGLVLILAMGVFTRPQLEHAFANTLAVAVAHAYMAFRKRPNQTRLIANAATIVIAILIIVVAVAMIGGWS